MAANEYGSRENRLPSLIEVLNRQTRPPVDLFSFYIYMRDQQRSVDYLDFWLDVSQHMSLCRHFVREMRRSVLLETPELEKAGSKRSSQVLDLFDLQQDSDSSHSHSPHRDRSASRNGNGNGNGHGNGNGSVAAGSLRSRQSFDQRNRDQRVSQILRNDAPSLKAHSHKDSADMQYKGSPIDGESPNEPPRPSFMSSQMRPSLAHDSSSPNESTPHHTVTRADIRASAEKILYTFLLQGSEREIILPQSVLLEATEAIEEHGRDDPEVFDAAKEYVFQAMERDAFPGFLRSKALGNLVPPSLMLRLICGLLSVFAGFWAAFIFVFTDKDRATRCWIILPFTFGVYLLASHQYTVDPIIAFAGYSEYTPFSFTKIGEPFVRKLLIKRAAVLMAAITLITVAVVCLFVFVPGTRL